MSREKTKDGQCKLCGQRGQLVQSHVIPRAFFDLGDNPAPTILSNTPGQYPKRAPAGVYDRIVCRDCEGSFGDYDNYAANVLIQNLASYEPIYESGKFAALRMKELDYRLLKLFAISVLWRASVSTQTFFSRVRLGPFEARARELLLARDPGDANEFGTWWSAFRMDWTPGLMDPFQERWDGVNAYRFYFGKVVAYIKVDTRPVPLAFQTIVMMPGRDLIFAMRDFDNSKDLKAMSAVLRTHVTKTGKRRSEAE